MHRLTRSGVNEGRMLSKIPPRGRLARAASLGTGAAVVGAVATVTKAVEVVLGAKVAVVTLAEVVALGAGTAVLKLEETGVVTKSAPSLALIRHSLI